MSDDEFEKLMVETRETYDECKQKLESCEDPIKIDETYLKEIVYMFHQTFNDLESEKQKEFISKFIRTIRYTIKEQQPIRPDKSKTGKGKQKVIITEVEFYQ